MSKIRLPSDLRILQKSEGGVLISGFEKCLRKRFLTLGIENYDQDGHFLFENFFMFFGFFSSKSEEGVLILDIEVCILCV